MKVLVPTTFTPAQVTSNITETEYAAYSAATTYASGARVIYLSYVYESLVGSNLNQTPDASPLSWLKVGPCNRWAMFDESPATVTTISGTLIQHTMTVGAVNTVVLLGVVATSVRLTLGVTVLTTVAVPAPVWPARSSTVVIEGLAIASGSLKVEVIGVGTTACSGLLIGNVTTLGTTQPGAEVSMYDFSQKATVGGVVSVNRGDYSRRLRCNIIVPYANSDTVASFMAGILSKPCFWMVPSVYKALMVYGYYRDWSMQFPDPTGEVFNLTLEGLATADTYINPGESDPASTLLDDAAAGAAAYAGTAKYRSSGVPTFNPVPTGITVTNNTNGTCNIRLDWAAYTQGDKQADLLLLFWLKGSTAPTTAASSIAFNVSTAASYYIFEGVNPADTYSFGIAAARRTEGGLEVGTVVAPTSAPDWIGVTSGTPNFTANVNGVAAATVTTATANFNTRNDRNAAAVVAPVIAVDGTAIDHVVNSDGSVDISFEWTWSGTAIDIDGFKVFVRSASANTAYTMGTTPAQELVYVVPGEKRAMFFKGVAADQFYWFAVQAYRVVDPDINAAGFIASTLVQASLAAENPYQPATSVAFAGNVTGTVNGIPAASVNTWGAMVGIPYGEILNADVASVYGFNPSFSDWPIANALPTGYGSPAGIACTRETVLVGSGLSAPRFTIAVAGNNAYFSRTVLFTDPLPAGAFISGSFVARLVSRTSGNPGILVDLLTNAAGSTYDRMGAGFPLTATALSVWHTTPWVARTTTLGARIYGIRIYVMGSWTGMTGGSFVGDVIFDSLQFSILEATTDAKPALDAAAAAQGTADTAAANATSALTALTNLASDNILSPVEKPSIKLSYDSLIAEQAGIDAQATSYSITTEKTTYDTAVSALTTYLGTLSGWNTIPGSDVVIVGTTFRTKFQDVYTARQALLNKIAAEAGLRASWATVSGIPYETIFNNDDSVALGFNPTFDWKSGTYPSKWALWGGTAPIKETTLVRVGTESVRYAAAGEPSLGIKNIWSSATPLPANTYIAGTVDIHLVAVTSGLPGILVRAYTDAGLTTYAEVKVVPQSAVGVWQRLPWTLRTPVGAQIYGIQIYVMASWSGFVSGVFTGTVVFDNLRFMLADATADAAYLGTANYRNSVAPSNNAAFGTITQSATADGNIVVSVPYTYTQGVVPADLIYVYYREGGGTVVAADPAMATNAASGSINFTLKPSTLYTFGLQAVRRVESGLLGTAILTSSNVTTTAGNYTGTVGGVAATRVVSQLPNLYDVTDWGVGVNGWTNYSGGPSNTMVMAALPTGETQGVWEVSSTIGAINWQGGPLSPSTPIDPTKTYRFIVPFRVTVGVASDGLIYIGVNGATTVDTVNTTTVNANAYILSSLATSSVVAGRWYYVVSYVYPAGTTAAVVTDQGMYDGVTGLKTAVSIANFNFHAGATTLPLRCGLYKSTAFTAVNTVQFGKPTLSLCDGRQADMQGVFAALGTVNYRNPSAPTNNAAFGTITTTATSDGNIVATIPYTYTQGVVPADTLYVLYKEGGGTVTAADPAIQTNPVTGSLQLTIKAGTAYTFGLQAGRRVEGGMATTAVVTSSTVAAVTSNLTGNLNGTPASTITTATTNFNNRNDRLSDAVTNPTIAADGTAIDHTVNTDGSVDISFEWLWGGTEAQIDGFKLYVRQSTSNAAYTMGTTPAQEQIFICTPEKRAAFFRGLAADQFYWFAVKAFRVVDPDINAAGVLESTLVQCSLAAENPYQPATSVAFAGNVSGTVGGIAVANVNSWTFINGRPQVAGNLVLKGNFEDGGFGGWALSVTAVTGQPWTKALTTSQENALELLNYVPVVAGEVIYAECDAITGATQTGSFGFVYLNAGLTAMGSVPCLTVPANASVWARYKGYATVPAGAVYIMPWIKIGAVSGFETQKYANLVLTRAVPTGQLVDQAATTVLSEDVTYTTTSTNTYVYAGFIAVTNNDSAPRQAIVTAQLVMEWVGSGNSVAAGNEVQMYVDLSPVVNFGYPYYAAVFTTTTAQRYAATVSKLFTIPANTTKNVNTIFKCSFFTGTATLRSNMRVELIKR